MQRLGILASRATMARDGGVAVEVVARPEGCSSRLQAFDCHYLTSRVADVVLAA